MGCLDVHELTSDAGVVAEHAESIDSGPVGVRLAEEMCVGSDVVDMGPVGPLACGVDRPVRQYLCEPFCHPDRLPNTWDPLVEVPGDHGGYGLVECPQQVFEPVKVMQMFRPRTGI